ETGIKRYELLYADDSLVGATTSHDDYLAEARIPTLLCKQSGEGLLNIGLFIVGHDSDTVAEEWRLLLTACHEVFLVGRAWRGPLIISYKGHVFLPMYFCIGASRCISTNPFRQQQGKTEGCLAIRR